MELNEKELNLNNPIFVFYVNTHNMSRQSAQALVESYSENLRYSNITTWVVPCDFTKVECLWGNKPNKTDTISKIEELFNNIGDNYDFKDLKSDIRKILISELNI